MIPITSVLNNQKDNCQLSTGENNLNQLTTVNCTVREADYLFTYLEPLVNHQFKPWYCKQFYRLGKTRVMEIAALAKADGREPAKLFSLLLKNAI